MQCEPKKKRKSYGRTGLDFIEKFQKLKSKTQQLSYKMLFMILYSLLPLMLKTIIIMT